MRKIILELEASARQLEPATGKRRKLNQQVTDYAEAFLDALPDIDTYVPGTERSETLKETFSEHPTGLDALLDIFDSAVNTEGINPASGGHMGYIPGGGLFPSALGDYLADVTNRYSGVAFASPGAAAMEQHLVRWMCELVGYPKSAGGDLTSGGSIANLLAVVAARESMGIRSRDVHRSCIYMTAQAHHCVDKSLRAAGLGECLRRTVAMDDRHRMRIDGLEHEIRSDRSKGLNPWLIIASAGTTDTGAIDPLSELAELADRHRLWLHVDAAYGGFFLLCEEGRELLVGLEKAHSIVLDPHKGMFLPYGSGAVLVRDAEWLARSQAYHADYMQDASPVGQQRYSPADLSLELSRPFRGMRFWLPLKLFGLAPFRVALREKIYLARYFHRRLERAPGWETGPYPELSVVTFRYLPAIGDADEFNRQLVAAVHEDGKVFISSTLLDGRFVMRLAILHFRTHLEHVDYLYQLLTRKAAEMDGG